MNQEYQPQESDRVSVYADLNRGIETIELDINQIDNLIQYD